MGGEGRKGHGERKGGLGGREGYEEMLRMEGEEKKVRAEVKERGGEECIV